MKTSYPFKDTPSLRHRCAIIWAFGPGVTIDQTKYVPFRHGVLIVPKDYSYLRFISATCIDKNDYPEPNKQALEAIMHDILSDLLLTKTNQ